MSGRRRVVLILATLIAGSAIWAAWRHQGRSQRENHTSGAPGLVTRTNPFLPDGAVDLGWTFIRGVEFDGHSPEIHLADQWPAAGPPVLWHRSLGQGYSSFVAAEERVFTQYQSISGQYVVCLSATTGETIWEYRYDWPFEATGLYPGPRATPTISQKKIFFTAPSGLVGCLTWEGKLVWQVETKEKFTGKGAEFGSASSPTVVDEMVILPVGGAGASVVALNASDGSTRWQSGDDLASYTPAYPINNGGQKQIIAYLQNALACFDQVDGKQLWRLDLSQGYDEHSAWPIFVEPNLWYGAPFRWGSKLLDLSTAGEPKEAWYQKILSNDVCSSAYHDGALFGFDLRDVQSKMHRPSRGVFRCLDFKSGNQLWETTETGHCSVTIADGKLFLWNDLGELIVARVSRERYEELARCKLLPGEICWSTPALDRGRIFVRNQKSAACVYVGDPDLFDRTGNRQPLMIDDIPQESYQDIAAILGVEPEYSMDVPSKDSLIRWFGVGLALLGISASIAVVAKLVVRFFFPNRHANFHSRRVYWGTAFGLGCLSLTALSIRQGELVFTWPVALFVAFDAVIYQVRFSSDKTGRSAPDWRAWSVVFLFLGVCLVYFQLCRRLSLAFEWVYLGGFPAAVPLLLLGRWLNGRGRFAAAGEWITAPLSFTLYYWSAVALLWWKYPEAL